MENISNTDLVYNELLNLNRKLSDELAQCKSEKDYVWKLYNELQNEKPNAANLINTFLEREQEKSDSKDSKVLLIFEQKDKEIYALKEITAELKKQLNISDEKINTLLSENSSLYQINNDNENKKNRMEKELSYKEEVLRNKERQLLIAETSRTDLESKIKGQYLVAEKSTLEVETRINELLESNILYQNAIETLNDKLKSKDDVIEELKTKFGGKEEKMKFLSLELENEIKKNHESAIEHGEKVDGIKNLKEIITKKNSDFEEMQNKLDEKEDEIHSLKQQNRELSKDKTSKIEKIHDLNEEVKNFTNNTKQIKEQLELIQSLEKLQDDTQAVLSQQETTHQREINTYQNTNYELKVTLEKYKNEIMQKSTEIKCLKKENNDLEELNDDLKIKERAAKKELETVVSELESLRDDQATKKVQEFDKSLLSIFTQTSPAKQHQFACCEGSTQTDDADALSDDESTTSSIMKRKKENLLNESQRLVALKSNMKQENRAMKKRILILENQCRQLNSSRLLIVKESEKIQLVNQRLKHELRDMSQQLEVKTNILKERSNELEKRSNELQYVTANQLKESFSSESLSKSLRLTGDELQVAVVKCTKLSFQLKTLSGENEILQEKQKSFQDRISTKEKIISQKKSLSDELKKKLIDEKNKNEKKSETIKNLSSKIKDLIERENKDKAYIEKLKSKLGVLIKEKNELQNLLGHHKTDADGKAHLLLETQKICEKAETAISTMEYTASQQLKSERMTLQRKEIEFDSCVKRSNSRINEYIAAIRNFAEFMLTQINEKRVCITQSKTKSNVSFKEDNVFQKKACDLACSILNMSEADLEEFMNNEDSDDHFLSIEYEDCHIKEKLDLILEKEVNFENILTRFLIDLVHYFLSIYQN